jgi:site-specific DNA recombinase
MRTLFAGLLRCPACGGPITAVDARRYGCNFHNDRGPAACSYNHTFKRNAVEEALLAVVRNELRSTDALAEAERALHDLLKDVTRAGASGALKARLKEVEGETERLIDAIAKLGFSQALARRLNASEAEAAELKAEMARAEALPTVEPRSVLQAYEQRVEELKQLLESESDRNRTRTLLADLLGPITLNRDGNGEWAEMEEPAQRITLTGSLPLTVVARARFELATFGL